LETALIDLDGTLRLKICEGRIAFIRIINKNLYTIYRFKRALDISDGQVYNKKVLDQEMEKNSRKNSACAS
jgi:hemolysin activation/secretion protein